MLREEVHHEMRGRFLRLGRWQFRWLFLRASLLRDRVAEIALNADWIALFALERAIVTPEAARERLVPTVARVIRE
jgi:hypothetical protein